MKLSCFYGQYVIRLIDSHFQFVSIANLPCMMSNNNHLSVLQFWRQGRGDYFQGVMFMAELSTPSVCLGKILIQVSIFVQL